jgi:hypothetical protein
MSFILDESHQDACWFAVHSAGDYKYGHSCSNRPYALIRNDAGGRPNRCDQIMWVCTDHYDYCIDRGWYEVRRA